MGEKLRHLGMEVALDFSLNDLNDTSIVSTNMVSFSLTTAEPPLHSVGSLHVLHCSCRNSAWTSVTLVGHQVPCQIRH